MAHYSQSLIQGGVWSNNRMRLRALECIELIIREKTDLERKNTHMNMYGRKSANRHSSSYYTETVGWRHCKSIYKWLSHYYILRKSIVLIVDTSYDSVVYRDKAMKYVKKLFEDKLDFEDYFGYISLDDSHQAGKDEIILDKKGKNTSLKKKLLKDIRKREIEYVFSSENKGDSNKVIRLERALEKAYEW